jgi:pimeloyl-ACP methyl ester carboxylesterase
VLRSGSRVVLNRRVLGVFCLLILAGGCRSAAERFLDDAAGRGLRAQQVQGAGFRHLVLFPERAPGKTLHVYLDGDGVPWLGGYPAADPTPRDPLVLDLLALDPAPAVYLGRPCYHGLTGGSCSPTLWTSARYSEAVVSSMAMAVRRVLEASAAERIVWLGYSGGGALAVLLAARLPETAGVVTVAANLDVDAWADRQGWSRLTGSLNPARQPPLLDRVYQRHYAGGRDRTVPVRAIRGAVDLVVVPEYDHRCCWTAMWPAVLADLERGLRARRD